MDTTIFKGLAEPHPTPVQSIPFESKSVAETESLGATFGRLARRGWVIGLTGDLGAGKTTLVRALLKALGHTGRVKSPTYTLVEVYDLSRLNLYHFDFYRLHNPNEWTDSGFREMFASRAACLVEWPEMAGNTLPLPDLDIHLSICGEGRRATLVANSESGRTCLSALKSRGSFS